jgi:hypothetical protein
VRREDGAAVAASTDWERVDLGEPAQREALDRAVAHMRAAAAGFTLFHDPAWLLEAEGRGADCVRVYVRGSAAGPSGYAPFVVQPWRIRFRLGESTLWSVPFERLHVNAGPIMLGVAGDPGEADALAALFAKLRPLLSRRQVIYLEGVVVGGAVDRAVNSPSTRAGYLLLEPSPRYERRQIRLPATFDAYLGSMKAQTRQNLRNTYRKLEKHAALRLVCCREPDRVADFVQRAVAISRKTYQWHLLGLGLRDPDELQRTLIAMARHGFTRCYLLECGEAATAFMIGYLYEGTYYYVDVGFDQDWEKWSVGTVLHMAVLKDLIEGQDRARAFDFSSGTGVHKKRFANEARLEAIYVLIPSGLQNRMLIAAYRGMAALSDTLVRVLDALHLKSAVKRFMRRRAVTVKTDE